MRVLSEDAAETVDLLAENAFGICILIHLVFSFVPALKPYEYITIFLMCLAWVHRRWNDPSPWLGHLSSMPTRPRERIVRVWAVWVKFWAGVALVLLVLEAILPPVIDFTKVPLGVAAVCALALSHLAMLRDLVFEWRLVVVVTACVGAFVMFTPDTWPRFALIIVMFGAPFVLRHFKLSGIGDLSYRPDLPVRPHILGTRARPRIF